VRREGWGIDVGILQELGLLGGRPVLGCGPGLVGVLAWHLQQAR
jgi:hypothetical protein